MISNTQVAKIIRVKQQISYHEYRLEHAGLDDRKKKLTARTVKALKWSLNMTLKAIELDLKHKIEDKMIDAAISKLRKMKYQRHRAQYDRAEAEVAALGGLDLESDGPGM